MRGGGYSTVATVTLGAAGSYLAQFKGVVHDSGGSGNGLAQCDLYWNSSGSSDLTAATVVAGGDAPVVLADAETVAAGSTVTAECQYVGGATGTISRRVLAVTEAAAIH